MTHSLRTYPFGWRFHLLLGVWMVAALMFGLFFPGSLPLGFIYGAVTGAALFGTMNRYIRRSAHWSVWFQERRLEMIFGGPRPLEDFRRRLWRGLGFGDPDRAGEVVAPLLTWLRRGPTILAGFVALVMLGMAADAEGGLEETMTGSMSGMCAVWALLFWPWRNRPIPGPHDPMER